ncbi:hypothetical protein [Saccharothrix australiensis]|uniref:Serine/threonine protein phosphatase PrpC n=1 Tax=Saccharothrix australiensis TaxID=2072 RepID=A0A495VZZ9_9PSEU|nr:hypothetical protein [Saccharothrix australiensis]RKT55022.1 serine/threonine protein phosphatase PrpC [Saccharothrix australiensis]
MTPLIATDLVVGTATSPGPSRPRNADAHAVHTHHGRVAAGVVDGTGSDESVAALAADAVGAAVRRAARSSPVIGVVHAAELCCDYDADGSAPVRPTGAIVVASTRPGLLWRIAWAGDSSAYGWHGGDRGLVRVTTPHTRGEELRREGAPEEEARRHDHQLLNSLARVPLYGVEAVEAIAPLLVLASDGLAAAPLPALAEVLRDHHRDPRACADALLAAARDHGSQDDITVVVIPHPEAEGR